MYQAAPRLNYHRRRPVMIQRADPGIGSAARRRQALRRASMHSRVAQFDSRWWRRMEIEIVAMTVRSANLPPHIQFDSINSDYVCIDVLDSDWFFACMHFAFVI